MPKKQSVNLLKQLVEDGPSSMSDYERKRREEPRRKVRLCSRNLVKNNIINQIITIKAKLGRAGAVVSVMLEAVRGVGRAGRAQRCRGPPSSTSAMTQHRWPRLATVGPPPRRGGSALEVQQQTERRADGGAEQSVNARAHAHARTHTEERVNSNTVLLLTFQNKSTRVVKHFLKLDFT